MRVENSLSNSLNQEFDIQAVTIDFSNPFCKVCYSVYYNKKEGWSEEVTNAQVAGTVKKKKSIFGIKIRLDDVGEKKFDILYRVHQIDDTWTAWARNGEELISGKKLNSLQIKLETKQTFSIDLSEPNKFLITAK